MKDRLRTLYLDCSGIASLMVPTDTLLRGILGYKDGDRPPPILRNNPRVNALFGELRDVHAQLSYVGDWRDAFVASPDLAVEVCNINNLLHLGRCLLRLRKYDLIIVSHTAAGDDMTVLKRSAGWFHHRRAPIVMFIGNEYDLLDEKIGFIRDVECELICSQLPIAAASYLYRECDGSRVAEMPHALNPHKYFPATIPRQVDIGFIGDIYWPFVGDRERTDLIEWFEQQDANFDEVFERFYKGQTRCVSGKSISSRHFEPIGTKTCQILLEGYYNGILEPDQHFIAVKPDLSNIDDAIERFCDEGLRRRMVEETYEYAISQHTYAHRVAHLLHLVTGSR